MSKASVSTIKRIQDRCKPKDPVTGCIEFVLAGSGKAPNPKYAMYIKDETNQSVSVLRVVYEHHTRKRLSKAYQIRRTCKTKNCVNFEHMKLIG